MKNKIKTDMEKMIAIYGGTFDPPHIGHALVVKGVSSFPGIDEVWLMPTPQNPLKEHQPIATPLQRIEMLEMIAARFSNVLVSSFEINIAEQGEEIYTYKTLKLLAAKYPNYKFKLVVGSDCVSSGKLMPGWMFGESILEEFGLIVYHRPGYYSDGLGLSSQINYLTSTTLYPGAEISSRMIRKCIENKTPITFYVPEDIELYIRHNKLYE